MNKTNLKDLFNINKLIESINNINLNEDSNSYLIEEEGNKDEN